MAANEETITIIIGKDGKQRVEAEGFKGEACSTEIGKLLAGKVVSDTKKPAFYEKAEKVKVTT